MTWTGGVPDSKLHVLGWPDELSNMVRFVSLFSFLLLSISLVFTLEPVREAVLTPWNGVLANIAYWLMQWFDSGVRLSGTTLTAAGSGFAVIIASECNAMEASLIVVSAMLAFPARIGEKLTGLLLGILAVQGVNLVRIVTLYYIGQWNRTVFEWTHHYLWPGVIIIVALVVFLLWGRSLPVRRTSNAAADAR